MATRSKMSVTTLSFGKRGDSCEELTIDERIQDGHGAVGNTGVRVNLLQDLIATSAAGISVVLRWSHQPL